MAGLYRDVCGNRNSAPLATAVLLQNYTEHATILPRILSRPASLAGLPVVLSPEEVGGCLAAANEHQAQGDPTWRYAHRPARPSRSVSLNLTESIVTDAHPGRARARSALAKAGGKKDRYVFSRPSCLRYCMNVSRRAQEGLGCLPVSPGCSPAPRAAYECAPAASVVAWQRACRHHQACRVHTLAHCFATHRLSRDRYSVSSFIGHKNSKRRALPRVATQHDRQ